jgi:hypothetical protein
MVWTTATMQKYAGYGPIVTVNDGEIRIAASMGAGRQPVNRSPVAKDLSHPSKMASTKGLTDYYV